MTFMVFNKKNPCLSPCDFSKCMITFTAIHAIGMVQTVLFAGTTGLSPPKDMDKKKGEMLKHFQEHVHNKFSRYAFGFFLCEFCNLLFAVICIYLTHIFLNYQFYDYGILVYR